MMALCAPIDLNYSKLNYTAMKHFNLLKTTLLLCALIVGSLSSWAGDTTDELTANDFSATSTTYVGFSDVAKTSGAAYAGNSGKTSSGGIQLRSKNSNSGIVSTTSGGKVKSITITVESGTNTIDIYGSNTAYTSASDLYNNSKQGTKLGSLTTTGTVAVTGDYEYVGIRSNSGALYITKVEITWTAESSDPTIIPSTSSLTFGEVAATDSKEMIFTVTPANLTGGLTIASSNNKYTVSPTSIPADAKGAQKITVTANPTSVNDDMNGTITISGSDFASDTKVTLSTTVIRKSPALAFDPTSVTLTRGEAFTAPTFSKDAGISFSSISFTSSYNDVATVSDEGVIFLGTSTGTAIVKANFEQTDVYAAGSATCNITVNPAGVTPEPNPAGNYVKVEDTKDLEDGKYLIVYEDGAYAMSDASNENDNLIEVTIDNNVITGTAAIDAVAFTFKKSTGSLKGANGKYIGRSTDSNGMDISNSELSNTVSIDNNGDAQIVGSGNARLRLNTSAGSNGVFRFYKSSTYTGQKAVQLYKFVAGAAPSNIEIFVSAAGYSTYASNFDLDFTSVADLKAYIAKEDNGIKMVQVNKVPKNTGILLRATDGGDKPYSVPTATTTDDVTGNLFVRGNDEAVASEKGSNHNYILNVVNNQLGFYKAYGNTVAKNRAYLQTTVAASRINLNFEDETTGIAEVKTNVKSDLFNINGQRVEKTAKGLYIMNGKKFIVK